MPAGLVDWFEEGATELEETLRQADLNEPFWQPPDWPSPGAQTIRTLLGAANVETAVHRWDAQLAHHRTTPINRAVAEMGIEQALRQATVLNRWYVSEFRKTPAPSGAGETYLFAQTDSRRRTGMGAGWSTSRGRMSSSRRNPGRPT